MERLEAASLTAIAMHKPERLEEERRLALASAAPTDQDEIIIKRALTMIREIDSGAVLVS
jgi:hypothetical protein